MKLYYVYMLECADGSFYVGITNNLERRVHEHQMGSIPACYTHERRPVRLVYSTESRDVSYAIDWEKKLKGWSRAKKRALIANDWDRIHDLAECTNETGPRRARRASFDSGASRLRSG